MLQTIYWLAPWHCCCNCTSFSELKSSYSETRYIVKVIFADTDINECFHEAHDCDRVSTVCINTIGSYSCKCEEGYENITGVDNSCTGMMWTNKLLMLESGPFISVLCYTMRLPALFLTSNLVLHAILWPENSESTLFIHKRCNMG